MGIIKKPPRKYLSKFFDSLRLHLKGGRGGHGHPQKNGLGGAGGDIIFIGDKEMTLPKVKHLNPDQRISAGRGEDAKLFSIFGQTGKSVNIKVPIGISFLLDNGVKIGEINKAGEKVLGAKGGAGGCEANGYSGQEGQAHTVKLDLKLIADVGFVGFPNAGKSTLLKAISRAKPKIASYPFTTIKPNLGIIEYPDMRKISLADLPGLIEGAHLNQGMGHNFLKHVERTNLLLFIIDIHGFQLSPLHPARSAMETIILLNRELELYLSDLAEKPAILALNKMDLPNSSAIVKEVEFILQSGRRYDEFLKTIPPEFIPEQRIKFDKIVSISAARDPTSVNKLKEEIRSVIDINHDWNMKLNEGIFMKSQSEIVQI